VVTLPTTRLSRESTRKSFGEFEPKVSFSDCIQCEVNSPQSIVGYSDTWFNEQNHPLADLHAMINNTNLKTSFASCMVMRAEASPEHVRPTRGLAKDHASTGPGTVSTSLTSIKLTPRVANLFLISLPDGYPKQ
jgi:hypothetical protein